MIDKLDLVAVLWCLFLIAVLTFAGFGMPEWNTHTPGVMLKKKRAIFGKKHKKVVIVKSSDAEGFHHGILKQTNPTSQSNSRIGMQVSLSPCFKNRAKHA